MTQQNRNIGIAIDQRDRNCKIGEGGGLACEKLEKNSRRTHRISQHHFVILSGKKQMLKHTTDANLTTMAEESACADVGMTWQRWCNALI